MQPTPPLTKLEIAYIRKQQLEAELNPLARFNGGFVVYRTLSGTYGHSFRKGHGSSEYEAFGGVAVAAFHLNATRTGFDQVPHK